MRGGIITTAGDQQEAVSMPAKKSFSIPKLSKKSKKLALGKLEQEPKSQPVQAKVEIALPAPKIEPDSVYLQEESKQVPQFKSEQTTIFLFDEKEKLITTFTAGGVVLSFGLSVGSVIIAPVWPAGGGLLATLGVISCFGAFMARESI